MLSVPPETLALTVPWLVKLVRPEMVALPLDRVVLVHQGVRSRWRRISEPALLRLTVPPPERLTVEASTTEMAPPPLLLPIKTVPLLVRSPVR